YRAWRRTISEAFNLGPSTLGRGLGPKKKGQAPGPAPTNAPRGGKRSSVSVHARRGSCRQHVDFVVIGHLRDGGVEVAFFALRRVRQHRNVTRQVIELEHRQELEAVEVLDARAQDDEIRLHL